MKLSIISFTENGILLSKKIAKLWEQSECTLYTKCKNCNTINLGVRLVSQGISEWVKEQFQERSALLFIGACGIAVRAIAPHVKDKLQDSPVLVMDEKGEYVCIYDQGNIEKVYIVTGIETDKYAEIYDTFDENTLFIKNTTTPKEKLLLKYDF